MTEYKDKTIKCVDCGTEFNTFKHVSFNIICNISSQKAIFSAILQNRVSSIGLSFMASSRILALLLINKSLPVLL